MTGEGPPEERWLGARWSTWGVITFLGSIAIAWLAVVTVIYGMRTTPQAFGPPEGLLTPDPALEPPFDPWREKEKLKGVPPVGVTEFSTGQALRLADGVLFEVTETAHDWSPPPPAEPTTELTMARVRLRNESARTVVLDPGAFSMTTEWEWEGTLRPVRDLDQPWLLRRQEVQSGQSAEGILVFAREDVRQVRRYLHYEPAFAPAPVRVLLIP